MREWLSGGAPPCQGGGRGFESRLALFILPGFTGLFLCHVVFVLHSFFQWTYISRLDHAP